MIRADNMYETTVELANADGYGRDKIQNFFLERYALAYQKELDAFIAAASSGKQPSPNGEDGLKANLLADAADASWRKKVRVEL